MIEESPYRVTPQKVKRGTRLVAVASNPLDVVNKVTGEVVGAAPYMGKRFVRDISDFVKLYDTSIFLVMSTTEMKLFSYVLSELDFEGKFRLFEDGCSSYTGLTRSAIYRGVERLVKKDIIRRDKKGTYWINPNIAYRGSRDELMR